MTGSTSVVTWFNEFFCCFSYGKFEVFSSHFYVEEDFYDRYEVEWEDSDQIEFSNLCSLIEVHADFPNGTH